MAIRKLYGNLNSPATLKVMSCLFEHDLEFEFVSVDLAAGENRKKEFLAMNPFGQVPVYQDGDIIQFESRAILRSMAHEHAHSMNGRELICFDSRMQAIVANWIDVEDHKFEPPACQLAIEYLVKPKKELEPDQAVVDEAQAKLAKVLDVYEGQLAKHKYIAMDKYTIADVLHLPNLQNLMNTPSRRLIESRPHVRAWCAEILARPTWVKVLEMQKKAQA
ncbi:Glutathione S-transferase, C-terminal [Dillenia turbinata]|uniref:glutathione transferase n=1 Tax=Dillenia turbinata TaxID=194707 RepID=A0AAN8ZKF5_9MAGN